MSWFASLWLAIKRERNRRRRWKHRTVYTFNPHPDERSTLAFWKNSWRN